ncbi:double-strand break repair protein AddB [Sneathiella glossodoripedis]|uniref:double-strand break repair protein AddB n=1 Tax=Sneathiella glossodoripedis TaxID=418853 RepID=UPI001F2B5B39|nr:double-strand break repair protein AddB [Sneathiella glossodoripedis]
MPATAALLKLVSELPSGCVVLPGLDRYLDEETWAVVEHEPSHPQYGLARLLSYMGITRADVHDLTDPSAKTGTDARVHFFAEAMRPASTTDYWQQLELPDFEQMGALQLIECSGPQAEAQVIALKMREVLETPNKTATLVTPDRDLSRRVSAELRRWGIEVDDSAGASLDQSPPGVFLRLIAKMVADRFDPLSVLAVLKHPYANMGYPIGRFRTLVRELEINLLRGPKPAEGLGGLESLVIAAVAQTKISCELESWFTKFKQIVKPLEDLALSGEVPFEKFLKKYVSVAEELCVSENELQTVLWQGHFGEEAASFISELLRASDIAGPVKSDIWPELLESLMVGRMVRSPYGLHPRLQIWGPIEARLQRSDVMILGGMNKGVWPPEQAGDPWMSRPMRAEFNLPLPEKKIGLSAHDFQQAFCAKEVVLTRSEKMDGAPTVPSRWILRLQTLLQKNGASLVQKSSAQWLHWQADLDKPDIYSAQMAPRPTPPVSARPRRLSVTRIEKWIKDPYSIFADAILNLKPLDNIGEEPGGAERGTFIHKALEIFVERFPKELPEDAEAQLLQIGREVFSEILTYPAVWAFWWPRFEKMAKWFVEFEKERRSHYLPVKLEAKGVMKIGAPFGPFELSGTADRIDKSQLNEVSIIDYKTGSIPTEKQVETGISPQLALEAAC